MKKVFLLLISVLITFNLTAQDDQSFDSYWKKVQVLELNGLTRSAALLADTIFTLASERQNQPQVIKALIYRSKFSLILKEDAQLEVVNDFKREIKKANAPEKNILESILGDLFWQYYQENRWRILRRSQTEEKVNDNDFRTWDLRTLFSEISYRYQNSLRDENILKQIDLAQYKTILETEDGSVKYRPTLYDFLAHRALKFYKNSESGIVRPADKFIITTEHLNRLEELVLVSNDTLSTELQTLRIYQKLLEFHRNRNTDAYVDVKVESLQFIADNAALPQELQQLKQLYSTLTKQYPNQPVSGLFDFEVALILFEEGEEYSPGTNEEHQFKKSEALQICNHIINQFPKSLAADKSMLLKHKILGKDLELQIESFIPSDKPSRILAKYSNLDVLNFRIYSIEKDGLEKFYEIRNDSQRLSFLQRLELKREWNTSLRNEKDYQQHASEIIVPALPLGNYLILARPFSTPVNSDSLYAFASFQVTDLALIKTNLPALTRYQMVNRNNGEPIVGAEVHIKSSNRESYYDEINKQFTTDKNGFIMADTKGSFGSVEINVSYKNDQADFGHSWLYNSSRSHERKDEYISLKAFVFTDRSIYRPGQNVYFKGILLKKSRQETELVSGEYVEVILDDVNGQEVGTLRLKTNKYGSFSGEFQIPESGITGEYTIYVDEDYEEDSKLYNRIDNFEWSETIISVEEYKRPRFHAEFSPVTNAIRLNDTISVTGKATAFAGNVISDAKVVYSVHRKVQYPEWFYWYRNRYEYHSEPMEITHGETTTDEDGSFTFNFATIPDTDIDKKNLPVFHYELTADVTDINGETRSATTVIKAGYHSITAHIHIPDKVDKASGKPAFLTVSTRNLNDQPTPATGIIYIYKIEAPEHVKRERPWPAPDYQLIPENEFNKLFPHEYYQNQQKDVKGAVVFTSEFDTSAPDTLFLNTIRDWNTGSYIIELNAKDPFGREVTDKQKFEVIHTKSRIVADNQLFIFRTDKSIYKPGESVNLTIGSASPNLTAFVDVEKNGRIVNTYKIHLSNDLKTLSIPIQKKDEEEFFIHYSFVSYNFHSGGMARIKTDQSVDHLVIETATFRNKLQPGSEETWKFNIKNDNGSASAELLASMYDTSLDQFRPHSWSFNPVEKQWIYPQVSTSAENSFDTRHFTILNMHRSYLSFYRQRYTSLNWFGFNFNNNAYFYRNYLNKVREKLSTSLIGTSTDSTRKSGFIFGKVTNLQGDPLPGINILLKGTTTGTVTNLNGEYEIEAKPGDVLVFSFIGMATTEVSVSNHNIIDIELAEDIQQLSEVVVTGYARSEKRSMAASVIEVADEEEVDLEVLRGAAPGVNITGASIRGNSTVEGESGALYVVDGVIVDEFTLNQSEIASLNVLKGAEATALYGARGANGVVVISTKEGQEKLQAALQSVKARKDFKETAFFYPHLTTDSKGNISFSFTTPESLTSWKLQLLAHNEKLSYAIKTLQAVTQKELMILPNMPRFFRHGDKITLSAKVTNLTDGPMEGMAMLQLFDAVTGKPVNIEFANVDQNKNYTVSAGGSTNVNWDIEIPHNIDAVEYKIVAKAGDFSDGEQNILPVLTNRMLVTESLPLTVRSGESKSYSFNKLKNINSSTLKHHKLTVEMTSNPAWYAVLALPYLMEYPYECSEQIFSRYYANSLARNIVDKNPGIKEVFKDWSSAGALLSNLEKNQELKSLLIRETPWLRDAQSETEQRNRIAILFDLSRVSAEQETTINKLKQMQMNGGGFPWFRGNRHTNRFISQHIAMGFGHLNYLNLNISAHEEMVRRVVNFSDKEITDDYNEIIKISQEICEESGADNCDRKKKEYLIQDHLSPIQIHYLYTRSFYDSLEMSEDTKDAITFFTNQARQKWLNYSLYLKGMIAVKLYRTGDRETSASILRSIYENSIINEELGMYWKENESGWYWYQSPVETQALMIEAFNELGHLIFSDEERIQVLDNLKIWLLKNKQTQQWSTTIATTKAVYALLLNGTDWINTTNKPTVYVAGDEVKVSAKESGTGYFKTSWSGDEIEPEMADIKVIKEGEGISWGAMYWQYFEELDKITLSESSLQISKALFVKENTDTGEELVQINEDTSLRTGDVIRVRIELRSDRNIEYVHMKDLRAAGVEPVSVLSEYKWQDGLGYYQSTLDASTNFFFEIVPKGVYVFEYDVRVNNPGNFSNGITTIECMYAPEFRSHSKGTRININ